MVGISILTPHLFTLYTTNRMMSIFVHFPLTNLKNSEEKSPENQGFLDTLSLARKHSFSCKVPVLRFPTFDFDAKASHPLSTAAQ